MRYCEESAVRGLVKTFAQLSYESTLGCVNTSCDKVSESLTWPNEVTYVDGGVVLDIVANGQRDVLSSRWKTGGRVRILCNDAYHVRRADAALEQDAGGAECAGGEDDAALGRERVDALVGADAGDLGAISDEVGNERVGDEFEVLARLRGAEVAGDRSAALSVDVVVRRVAVRMVLEIGVIVDGDCNGC